MSTRENSLSTWHCTSGVLKTPPGSLSWSQTSHLSRITRLWRMNRCLENSFLNLAYKPVGETFVPHCCAETNEVFFGGGTGLLWYVYVTYTRCLVSCCFRSLWWQALDIAEQEYSASEVVLWNSSSCPCVTHFWDNLSSCSKLHWHDLQRYWLSFHSWTLQINTCFGFKSSVAPTYTCMSPLSELSCCCLLNNILVLCLEKLFFFF